MQCSGRWSEPEWAEDRRWIEGGVKEVVRIKDLHEGTAEEVPKVATGGYPGIRYCGQRYCG